MAAAVILRVGLTGNIGAGKSTVAATLRDGGCLIIDADELARGLLGADSEVAAQIVDAFGSGVRAADGSVDRAALAAVVFGDKSARRRLEAITHPHIRELEERRLREWGAARGIAVTEAALLVETGGVARYHRLLVVTAPGHVRLRRLLARGMDEEDVRARMQAQLPEAEKRALADYVIDNGGSLPDTRRRTEEVLQRLREDLHILARGGDLQRRPDSTT